MKICSILLSLTLCFAVFGESELFLPASTSRAIAGKFNIGPGNGPVAVDAVEIEYSNDSICAGSAYGHTLTAGDGYTLTASTLVSISAAGLWNFGNGDVDFSLVQSILLTPRQGATAAFTTPSTCIVVTCAGGQCIGTDIISKSLAF